MVGSKHLSGLGRSVLCESLESRQFFNQTAALDAKFGGDGIVTTSFGGGNERAFAAVAQSDGRIFVTGKSEFGGTDSERSVFARYLSNGSLDTSFSGDGKLVLTVEQQQKFGLVSRAYQVSGGYLLSASNGVFRMKTDGTIDSSFGTNGKIDVGAAQLRINSDGSFRTYSYDGQYNKSALWTAQGKIVGAYSASTYGRPILMDDGNVVIVGYNQRLTLYTADMKKVKTFGISGDTYLQGVFDKYLRDGRAWYDTNGNKLSYLPSVNIESFSKTRDGGYLVSAFINGRSEKYNNWTEFNTGVVTIVTVKLDAAGNSLGFISKTDAYGYSTDNRSTVDYRPNPGQFAGNLLFGVGDGIHMGVEQIDGAYLQRGNADAAKTPTGAYVLFGNTVTASTSANGGQFTVALTQKVTQSISGRLFNDNNRNGVYDKGDTLNPGRTVFLDQNYNDTYDVGEPTVLTDANGKYTFTNLGVGNFHVRRVFPDSSYYYTTSAREIFLNPGDEFTRDIGSNRTSSSVAKSVLG